jgi:hypothetical protein
MRAGPIQRIKWGKSAPRARNGRLCLCGVYSGTSGTALISLSFSAFLSGTQVGQGVGQGAKFEILLRILCLKYQFIQCI